jgi:hypothetical protein
VSDTPPHDLRLVPAAAAAWLAASAGVVGSARAAAGALLPATDDGAPPSPIGSGAWSVPES